MIFDVFDIIKNKFGNDLLFFKFAMLFKNILIVFNENGIIVDWRLIKFIILNEINNILFFLKERLFKKEIFFNMICVNNCFKN